VVNGVNLAAHGEQQVTLDGRGNERQPRTT
jgi:hypothetical protein